MEVFLTILAILSAILLYPYLRLLVKRLIMRRKLGALCREKGYTLYPAHRFWLLGRKMGKSCDFYVETHATVYAVKLFGMRKRGQFLIFATDGTFCARTFLNFFSFMGGITRFFNDSRPRNLPEYDFRVGFRDEWYLKNICPVLLLHPTCIEVHLKKSGGESIIGSSEAIADCSFSTRPSRPPHTEKPRKGSPTFSAISPRVAIAGSSPPISQSFPGSSRSAKLPYTKPQTVIAYRLCLINL